MCAFFGEKDVFVGTPKILQIWVDFQSQPFVLDYLNNSHQATRKMSKLPMAFSGKQTRRYRRPLQQGWTDMPTV